MHHRAGMILLAPSIKSYTMLPVFGIIAVILIVAFLLFASSKKKREKLGEREGL
jgi:hypothetical protein